MKLCYSFLCLLVFVSSFVLAQTNFTYLPAKPHPGDEITISYTPAGALANTMKKVEAAFYVSHRGNKRVANDLPLVKKGKTYTATIKTDTSANFIQFGFYVDKDFDNNFNDGYFIQLNGENKVREGSYSSLSFFYQYYGRDSGVDPNNEKAFSAIEQEIALYPESKPKNYYGYFNLLGKVKPESVQPAVEKEIETRMKMGLKSETDYSQVETLYTLAKLPEQSKFVNELRKKAFPEGNWVIEGEFDQLYAEQDKDKKVEIAKSILNKIATNEKWKTRTCDYCKTVIFSSYIRNEQWSQMTEEFNKAKNKADLAGSLNNIAWEWQEKDKNIDKAVELAALAATTVKQEMKNPSQPKPDYLTAKNWDKQREYTYTMYADTYAMTLYKKGDYKKGYEITKEAAITINHGKSAGQINTYAMLAEKALSPSECKKEFEEFVKEGKASSVVTERLKNIYTKEHNNSAEGFDAYLTALEKEAYLKMVEEVRKSIIDKKASTFALKNLKGENVSLENLKGKVVVVDFWATWCGPCKASFPAMQKVVTKYQDNPDVVFLFIDTWESGDNKLKNASDFIEKNRYTFNVLMDDDNKVIDSYAVGGIPTKFLLDKSGQIRFTSIGFDGNDDKLTKEMDIMIALCDNPSKTF